MTFDRRTKAKKRRFLRKLSYALIPVVLSCIIVAIVTAISFAVFNYGQGVLKKATSWDGDSNSVQILSDIPYNNVLEGYEWQ